MSSLKVVSDNDYSPKYLIEVDGGEQLILRIRSLFFKTLEKVIEEEIGKGEYRLYFDQFYKSGFYKNFDLRTTQLASAIQSISEQAGQYNQQKIDALLDREFFAFIDHFLVMYAGDLHGMQLPESMLKYAYAKKENTSLQQMIFDYLDFESEKEKVYKDLMNTPPDKIKNAFQSFLNVNAQEKIYFICDQTVFGSCKEGFAMTSNALYWKSHFNEPEMVAYAELGEIKKEAEWITINGCFFNVHPNLNFKMLKLLKKIRSVF